MSSLRRMAGSLFSPEQKTRIGGALKAVKKRRRQAEKFWQRQTTSVSLPEGRKWRSEMPAKLITSFAEGAKNYEYRGLRCLKFPTEMALYTLLIDRIKPRTIIEIGSKEGGSALWLADQLRALDVKGQIVSIDIESPEPYYKGKRPDITLLAGDAGRLEDTLKADRLNSLARPWLVIEDASHKYKHTLAVLRFFDKKMRSGEYLVIEDGVVSDMGRADEFDGGPNRAIAEFLTEAGDRYEIDTELCDFYGHNVTGNPNGYLRRKS